MFSRPRPVCSLTACIFCRGGMNSSVAGWPFEEIPPRYCLQRVIFCTSDMARMTCGLTSTRLQMQCNGKLTAYGTCWALAPGRLMCQVCASFRVLHS